jgi:Flp pilus assembly protein TadG
MLLRGLHRLFRDSRGNIGVMTAILIIPVVGALGLATEASGWFLVDRAEQSAADSAALAAAANNDAANGGTGYVSEAKAVASNYGFTDGSTIRVFRSLIRPSRPCRVASVRIVTL